MRGERPVITGIAVAAALVTGGLFGSFLTMTVTAATTSWWQERMQRKVRLWQIEVEAARSRDAMLHGCQTGHSHDDG
jgi:hypothetical protein